MVLAEMLTPQRVKIPLRGTTKTDIIAELIDVLAANGDLADADAIRRAVLAREQAGSTGSGRGFALPHAKTDHLDHCLIALGRTVEPVEFGDGTNCPVTLVALLIAPPDEMSVQIQLLAYLSRLMSGERLRRKLNQAMSPREMIDLITREERAAA